MEIFKLFGSILVEDKAAMNSLQKVDKEGSKLAEGFSKVGKIIAGAFSVAAIVGFGKKVVEASADLKAMEAQFDQVFKDDNSQAVDKIAKQVDDLGIHTDRLTVSWNKFGGQVKGAGMEGEQALEAVDKATRLAADAAAFYDRSLENTSGSLASFMKGNFEAGDAIGVFTNAKQMDVRANETLGKSWADLTEAERQWLLLETVEKTYELNGAMGQAAREAGEYENVMGNLKATFTRLYATIGEPVLEIFLIGVNKVTDGVEWLQDKVENADINFDKFGDAVRFVKDNLDILIPILAGVTAAFTAQMIIDTIRKGYAAFKTATEGTTAAQVILNAVMSANPFGVAAIAIGLLVAAGVALYKNWDIVKEKAIELGNKIPETWDNVKTKTSEAWDNVKTKVKETITGLATDAVQWGKDIVTGLWDGITGAKDWVVGKVKGFASDVAGGFKSIFRISSPSKLMAEYGGNIVDGLVKGIDDNENKALSTIAKFAKEITGEFDRLGNAVITALKKRYQQEEKLQLDSLQKQVDNLKRKTDEKLQQYDRELQAKLEVLDVELSEEERKLQAQIDAINNLTTQEEKELKEQEYQNKVAAKEKELLDAESADERLKIHEELNQMRAEKERQLLLEHRSMQISALQQEMARIREQATEKRTELELEYEEKKKNEENKLNTVITNLENEIEATKTHYASLLEEENLQAEARRLILDENNQELVSLLESYNPAWQNAGQSFGESLLEGLNSMKQSIQDAVDDILGIVNTADMANARIIQAKVDWQSAYERGDQAGMDEAHQRAEKERSRGGTIGADIPLQDARITQNITINSPTPLSPSETARQIKNASRQLAIP
ncbi:MAG: hypothetical protein RIN55_05560 [Tissierellaceae bacterium]|nr:hypothetical protein [Tissierellaceae bacterium]